MILRLALVLTAGLEMTRAAIPPKIDAFPEGERMVYARIIGAYRANKVAETKRHLHILEKNYPQSPHLAHAYYLNGVLEFQNGNYAGAVKNFGIVAERFPQSRKRSAALFAKATTYDRLNLRPLALGLWRKIARQYPGSQEAQRSLAQLQLKGTKATRR